MDTVARPCAEMRDQVLPKCFHTARESVRTRPVGPIEKLRRPGTDAVCFVDAHYLTLSHAICTGLQFIHGAVHLIALIVAHKGFLQHHCSSALDAGIAELFP